MMKRLPALLCAIALLMAAVQIPPHAALAAAQINPLDATEIAFSYEKLRSDFYQKTDGQAIVNGARAELDRALRASGVVANLPQIVASDDTQRTAQAVGREVDVATKAAKGKVSSHILTYAAISGMLNSVHDRYTVFMTPKEFAALNQGLDGGTFGGTGIVIQADDATKYIQAEQVIPDGPAAKAGVEQGDFITAIDGTSTKGMTLDNASKMLKGKIGTQVQLTIERSGTALPPISITRAEIHQLSVYEHMLAGNIGYIEVTVFGRDTGAELNRALTELQQKGARALVLDLRDNPGGYLDAAIDVSSKFIASGPIVSVESRASNVTTYEADATAIKPMPLAVLVNDHTASASEITSGAIQDTGVGTIIGTKTFGKGVVQEILPLPDGSAIKITDAKYFTPHNRDINHIGITPDITVTENKGDQFSNPARDAQLQRAMQFLNDRIARIDTGIQYNKQQQQ